MIAEYVIIHTNMGTNARAGVLVLESFRNLLYIHGLYMVQLYMDYNTDLYTMHIHLIWSMSLYENDLTTYYRLTNGTLQIRAHY